MEGRKFSECECEEEPLLNGENVRILRMRMRRRASFERGKCENVFGLTSVTPAPWNLVGPPPGEQQKDLELQKIWYLY
jgi:hypothetical protein